MKSLKSVLKSTPIELRKIIGRDEIIFLNDCVEIFQEFSLKFPIFPIFPSDHSNTAVKEFDSAHVYYQSSLARLKP